MMVTSMLYLTLTMNYFFDNYILNAKYRGFPISTQLIGPPLDRWLGMLLLPFRNFASLSYLKEDFKLRLLIDACTMFDGALVSDSLLHMLPY